MKPDFEKEAIELCSFEHKPNDFCLNCGAIILGLKQAYNQGLEDAAKHLEENAWNDTFPTTVNMKEVVFRHSRVIRERKVV